MKSLLTVLPSRLNCFLSGWITRNKKDVEGTTSKRFEFLESLRDNQKAEFRDINTIEMSTISKSELNKEYSFQFSYAEVSAKTGEGVEEALRQIVEKISLEKFLKKAEAKKERDFGTTVIYQEKKLSQAEMEERKKCCDQI